MILTDDTRPSHFAFANQVGVQTDNDSNETKDIPDELRRTIDSHLWLTNLEVSSGITPTMSMTSAMPRGPHPYGPTGLTISQLDDAQLQLERAHIEQDISRMLKGVVFNMHCLVERSRTCPVSWSCALSVSLLSRAKSTLAVRQRSAIWSLRVAASGS